MDAERVPGTPLTLRLENVPEREALDIVLRSAAGYIAAPRAQVVAGSVSRFDRVIVMATSPGASTAARPRRPLQRPSPAALRAVVQHAPVQVEEEVVQAQPAVVEEAANGAAAPEQPASSTNFDYANPQRYFAARQAEQQAAEARSSSSSRRSSRRPARWGRSARRPPARACCRRRSRRERRAGNGAAPANPYGLPAGQQPGSSPVASPLEPDRAKYINPYSPTPPRP